MIITLCRCGISMFPIAFLMVIASTIISFVFAGFGMSPVFMTSVFLRIAKDTLYHSYSTGSRPRGIKIAGCR